MEGISWVLGVTISKNMEKRSPEKKSSCVDNGIFLGFRE